MNILLTGSIRKDIAKKLDELDSAQEVNVQFKIDDETNYLVIGSGEIDDTPTAAAIFEFKDVEIVPDSFFFDVVLKTKFPEYFL